MAKMKKRESIETRKGNQEREQERKKKEETIIHRKEDLPMDKINQNIGKVENETSHTNVTEKRK